jgi:hypothetical protein
LGLGLGLFLFLGLEFLEVIELRFSFCCSDTAKHAVGSLLVIFCILAAKLFNGLFLLFLLLLSSSTLSSDSN